MYAQPVRIKPRSVSLAFFNANGLSKQRVSVQDFLIKHQIDVMLVQETFLDPGHRNPRIANFQMVRNDRPGAKGGTVIYYKRSLHCMPLDTPPLIDLEASVCRLAMTGHPSIIIASCYLSPSKTILKSDLEALLNLGSSVILAGDFNCKNTLWNCVANNPNGIKLDRLVDTLNFDIIPPMAPTHYPFNVAHRPDILDFALLKNTALRLRSIEVLHELDSDHRPVLLKLGPPSDTSPPTKTVVEWHKLEKALKSIHSPDLDRIPDDIRSPLDVATAIDSLTSHVTAAVRASSKQVPVAADRRSALPDEVRRLLTESNAATRHYSSWPTEENRVRMRSLHREVRKRIHEHRDREWDSLLSGIEPSHLAYWNLARSMKSDEVATMPPLSRPNLPPAFDDDDKANCLAETLEAQCSPSLEPIDPVHLDMVNSEVERLVSQPPSAPALPLIKASEVLAIIKDLHPRKSPGDDGISNRVLKQFSVALIYLLVSIFNAAMATCTFPDTWKEANVIGIRKPGKNQSEPSSYRPISLLSSLGKIYERLLLSRLWSHVNELKLLPNEQFGFRARHSCPQQVLRITEHVLSKFNHTWPAGTGAIFLDVAKAFDKVWHNGLIYKLFKFGVPDRLVLILRDYLQHRSFRYRVEGTLSSPHPIRAGVPQGSVLAPLLFTLYTSDMPRAHHQVEIALFADDTALYTSDRNSRRVCIRLQEALTALGEWFRKWRIEVNPEKSAAVYFSRGRPNPKAVSLFGKPIPWVKSARYLGVILDSRLTFLPHIKKVSNHAKFILGRLTPLICKKSKMSLRNKVTLYKACIRPIMTYASVVFAHSNHVKKLQIVQNRFLRKATGSPWFVRNADLHRDLDLESIALFMKHASQRHYERAADHPNPLIASVPDYPIEPPALQSLRRPRHVLGDPDDEITAANAGASSSNHDRVNTTQIQRLRRRGRRLS